MACFAGLSGCATTGPTPPIKEPVPSHLLALCGGIPKATSGALPDLVRNHIEVVKSYAVCAEMNKQKVEWLAKDAKK